MSLEHIEPPGRPPPLAPYSSVVIGGDLVAISGQVALTRAGTLVSEDFREQATQVFENLCECLEAAGCSVVDVMKVTAYLADKDDFAAFNEIYRSVFREPLPARTTVQAGLLHGFKIEIDALAYRGPEVRER